MVAQRLFIAPYRKLITAGLGKMEAFATRKVEYRFYNIPPIGLYTLLSCG
jgi:hypothetical protein